MPSHEILSVVRGEFFALIKYISRSLSSLVSLKLLLQMYPQEIASLFIFSVRKNLFTLTTTDYVMWRNQNYMLEFYFVSRELDGTWLP